MIFNEKTIVDSIKIGESETLQPLHHKTMKWTYYRFKAIQDTSKFLSYIINV